MKKDKRLQSYDLLQFDDGEFAFPLYKKGPAGDEHSPAIIVMHEVPGIYPSVIDFSERLIKEGYTVYMPSLLGKPGKSFSLSYVFQSLGKACISKEFKVLAGGQSSPISNALRALCRQAHEECGGVGVGAIGMCLTGNFALSLMVDESVIAPVLSQPSLPLAVSKKAKAAIHVSDDELQCIKDRVQNDGVKILGLRFTHDRMCPPQRFERLKQEFGDGFEAIEISSKPGNKNNIPVTAHSVVTKDLVDQEGHPTQAALHRVLSFYRERLLPA